MGSHGVLIKGDSNKHLEVHETHEKIWKIPTEHGTMLTKRTVYNWVR